MNKNCDICAQIQSMCIIYYIIILKSVRQLDIIYILKYD